MGNAGRWWHRVSAAAVLTVLAVAMIAGLRPTPGVAVALRASAPGSAPAPAPVSVATVPGAVLAPVAAARAIASRGGVAYTLAGTALTLEDVPPRALSAYQRAATVIDRADEGCQLDWELLAALGKVLTDHGRVAGSELDGEGVPRPLVVGQRLTGRQGTPRVPDSDAGLLDRDSHVDRAVGPMLLLPAVWSVVSVDGDGDGRRNPQDVDDAALGAAVFLCAGEGDLRNPAHRRAEIRRYHGGSDYVRSVLSVRLAYLDAGELATVSVLALEEGVASAPPFEVSTSTPEDPTYVGSTVFEPGPGGAPTPSGQPTTAPTATPGASPSSAPSPSDGPTSSGTASPSDEPSPTASPSATDGPSGCASPSESPSPTGDPTDCPSPSDSPSPAAPPSTTGDASPAAGFAAPVLPLLPVGAWLWRRRRQTAEIGTPHNV